jgi:sugar O-acyltransferase (sialic acid O-acetyltransferase NeuD family)
MGKTSLVILGAGGHAQAVAEWALLSGSWAQARLVDKASVGSHASSKFGPVDDGPDLQPQIATDDVIVGIGNNLRRSECHLELETQGFELATVIHPAAVISPSADIGQGTVAAPLSVVNRAARIGKSVILNTSSSVDHDCAVGDFSHVSPGARLAGGVTLGRRCWVGIGASIIEGIKIADDVVIGAGAAVVEDITEPGVYVGVPARRIKP